MTTAHVPGALGRFAKRADDILRGRSDSAGVVTIGGLFGAILAFGLIYGSVMGAYGGLQSDRVWQIGYSALKVPLLLLATFTISLPSFFVLNTLMGLRGDFLLVVRALVSTQAGLTIVLASLAPLTALWYLSFRHYQQAVLFNGLMFGVASVAAQALLARSYRPLIERDARHRPMLRCWLFIYVFVGIQMGWVLRPFVGDPSEPVQFFRKESWANAYLVVLRMIWQVFTQGI